MREHPILFKTEMVRALLRDVDPKTQTRRANLKTKYVVGDRLWVKETAWWGFDGLDGVDFLGFVADDECPYCPQHPEAIRASHVYKVPSLFMRKGDSRILLEITALREERLQDITGQDAIAEGIERPLSPNEQTVNELAVWRYRELWESINGPGSWDENPVIKVITFRRLTP